MIERAHRKKVRYDSMMRVTGKNVPVKPILEQGQSEFKSAFDHRQGSENIVYDVTLRYGKVSIPKGFVFRKMRVPNIAQLKNTLEQWEKIRAVARELRKKNLPGFNIPGTIRGVYGKKNLLKLQEEVAGIVVTDLSEDGEKEIFDLKRLAAKQGIVSLEEWSLVREAVERDLDIAEANNIPLASGDTGLDPWLVVKDKDGHCSVYIADIGESWNTREHHRLGLSDPPQLKAIALSSLDALEKRAFSR